MKKRILYIGNALSRRGSTITSIEHFGGLLRKEGYTVHITSTKKNKVIRMLDMMWATCTLSKKVDIVLIDTYSTTNFWYAIIVGRLCEFFRRPYIPILHGGNLPTRVMRNPKISKRLFKTAKVNIAPSYYLFNALENEEVLNLECIPNSISLENYNYKKRISLLPKLLWVRSFASIYNPMMALRVLEELLKEYPEASLTMVGPAKDGVYEKCFAFAKAQNLKVNFTGLLSKKEWIELAASHDIFISTTNFDNTPVSVIEAMALGLPVVSTNVGGMPFLINQGIDGLLCPPKKIQPFVASIKDLLSQPELANSLAENARKKAESFDWSVVKKRWEEVLS